VRRYIVNRYWVEDKDRGTSYQDSVEEYSKEELMGMGSTPEEAEEIAKFMHRDRMRQQRGWKKFHKKETPDNMRLADTPKAEEIAAVSPSSPWKIIEPDGCKHIKPKKTDQGSWEDNGA